MNLYELTEGLMHRGYPCTVDCSGHMAGEEYAARWGLSADECPYGSSNSFWEGCKSHTDFETDDEIEEGSVIDATAKIDVYLKGKHNKEEFTRLIARNFPNNKLEALIKKLVDKYKINPRAIVYGPSREINENQDTEEIHNYKKLDSILVKLVKLVKRGQDTDAEKYGLVAACVLDPDNNIVYGINLPAKDGTRYHAERVAITKYKKQYGSIPKGSIIITTCSPCSEPMSERYGESCTDIINNSGVGKVYCGFHDPTQDEEQREFNIMETSNRQIRDVCEQFADQFLHIEESWSKKYKRSINCKRPKGFSQRQYCKYGRKK